MQTRTIILFVALFTLIVVGMFTFAYLKSTEQNTEVADPLPQDNTEVLDLYSNITRVNAKHFLEGNNHTIIGEFLLPTPCDLLSHETIIRESFPEQVEISFSITNESNECIAVESPQRFSVEVTVSPQASFSATLNGRAVELNLIPASPGETPDDFEFVQKG